MRREQSPGELAERWDQSIECEVAKMAADPEIQREVQFIEAEFAGTEANGLDHL